MMTTTSTILIAAGALLMATPVMAAPVYLECQLTGEAVGTTATDAPYNWKLTINEDEGRVDWENQNASGRTAAHFTANVVKWGSFAIDRTNLTFTRMWMDNPNELAVGKCRVIRAPARAF